MVLVLLVDTNFKHCLTDLHMSEIIMRMLPIGEMSLNFLV